MATTSTRARNVNHGDQEEESTIGGGMEDLAAKAQKAIEAGLQNLDPQVLQWGQTALASASMVAGPVRRSFKTQPILTGAGVAALAAGGIMLALAISRDVKASPRKAN